MLNFQDEEISKGEKKMREWRVKFIGLRNKFNYSINEKISEQFEDILLSLDKMKIKVEEFKNPSNKNFESIRDEINGIDKKISNEYKDIENKLIENSK